MLLKNPKTTIAGILVAIAGVLSAATKDQMALHDWLQLVGTILAAVALFFAKDSLPSDPPAPVAAIPVTVVPAAAKLPLPVLAIGAIGAFMLALVGCGATAPQIKTDVSTVALVAEELCALEQVVAGASNPPAIMAFCKVVDDDAPPVVAFINNVALPGVAAGTAMKLKAASK